MTGYFCPESKHVEITRIKWPYFFAAKNYVINFVVINGYAEKRCLQTFVNAARGHGGDVWLIDRLIGSREQPAARIFRAGHGSGGKGLEGFLQSAKVRR